jgi:hypothetical protein
MEKHNNGLCTTASECDIESLFEIAIEKNENPQQTFNQMLQAFIIGLNPTIDASTLRIEIATISHMIAEYLTLIEYEIVYS